MDETGPDFLWQLCALFQVKCTGNDVDVEEIECRQERLKRLRTITNETEYIQNINSVAFDQEELADLLDEGAEVIYLCGTSFHIPISQKNIMYIGINKPVVHLSGNIPGDMQETGIVCENCRPDNWPEKVLTSEENVLTQFNQRKSQQPVEVLFEGVFRIFNSKEY